MKFNGANFATANFSVQGVTFSHPDLSEANPTVSGSATAPTAAAATTTHSVLASLNVVAPTMPNLPLPEPPASLDEAMQRVLYCNFYTGYNFGVLNVSLRRWVAM